GGIVMTSPKSTTQPINMFPTAVRPDGQFTITGLAPGEYTLRAGNPTASEMAFADVTVTGSDITGVQLVTTKPSTIRGRVVFTDSATAAGPPKPNTVDLGAVREWALGQPVRSAARVSEDGTFEISLNAGHVLMRAAPTGSGGRNVPPWRLNRVLF